MTFYPLSENGKQTNQNDEEELANKNNLLELKKWVYSYVQQTWPITWEEGQDDLKEIIEREIDPSLFEEVRNGKNVDNLSNAFHSFNITFTYYE